MRTHGLRVIAIVSLLGTVLLFGPDSLLQLRLRAQEATSVRDGVYTEEQASQGAPAYQKECASCHGALLDGKGQAPPLTGAEFTGNWNGMTVGDLFEKIQDSMPADRPGQLTRDENVLILAFVLKSNRFPSGAKALPADAQALARIRFEAAAPAK